MEDNKILENDIKEDEELPEPPLDDRANQTLISPDIIGKYLSFEPNGNATIGDYDGGQGMQWNQLLSTLTILGSITAESGSIGGFEIGENYIRDTEDTFGLSSSLTSPFDLRIWGGTTYANRFDAELQIYARGLIILNVDEASSSGRMIAGHTNGVSRWQMQFGNGASETGSDAVGSNFVISGHSDNGTLRHQPFFINRSTGNVLISQFATSGPDSTAILEVQSTAKGFLPPRMTTAQRDAITPVPAGLMIYNTTSAKLQVYTTTWETITSA